MIKNVIKYFLTVHTIRNIKIWDLIQYFAKQFLLSNSISVPSFIKPDNQYKFDTEWDDHSEYQLDSNCDFLNYLN